MFVNIVMLLTGIVYLKIPPKKYVRTFDYNILHTPFLITYIVAPAAIFADRWQGQLEGNDSICISISLIALLT